MSHSSEVSEAEESVLDDLEDAALSCLAAAQTVLGLSDIDFAWWLTLQAKSIGGVDDAVDEVHLAAKDTQGSC